MGSFLERREEIAYSVAGIGGIGDMVVRVDCILDTAACKPIIKLKLNAIKYFPK